MSCKIVLVIAGDIYQYTEWKLGHPGINSKFVRDAHHLMGYPNNTVNVILVGDYERNPLYNSQALKVFMDNHEISKEQNCNNCEYYHQGICNASNSPTDNPLEINDCSDWILVDREARKQANKKLQQMVTNVEKVSTAYESAMRKAYEEARERKFCHQYLGVDLARPNPQPRPQQELYTHIMNKINQQRDYIRARYNLEPSYIMIHPRTFRAVQAELSMTRYYPESSFKKLVRQHFELDIVEAAHIRELEVEVVISADDLMKRR